MFVIALGQQLSPGLRELRGGVVGLGGGAASPSSLEFRLQRPSGGVAVVVHMSVCVSSLGV